MPHSAVNENTVGEVQSFSINEDGSLSTVIDTVSSGGDGPAFATALSTGSVAVMNYGSGNASFIPTSSDGETFNPSAASSITFTPPAGGVSHPHMALEYGDEVFIPDLVSNHSLTIVMLGEFLAYWYASIGRGHNLAPQRAGERRWLSN